ncbi:hypothetical protein GQ43DRAFT_453323 [Delitschia confertaspora ATCC 74209]|uniref:37S ribosomal protein Rsm22 n=1 Tax=Delitschia confertaspora ATCC 74209 TaxID=1513339 RepID=A0A9P4MWF7_9PLEO|nr:hypothetical protein GQ43DRAFT_453323 [Delitschia confertaspora ATCC 74209]
MFGVRNLPSVCISCRLRILAAQTCKPVPGHLRSYALSSSRQSTRAVSVLASRSFTHRRQFSSTLQKRDQSPEATTEPSNSVNIPPGPPVTSSNLSVEEVVRRARQTFGDSLPRGHLSEEQYVVYERLYGEPLFVDEADAAEVEEAEEGFLEEVGPDGSTVVLKTGKDGEVEEIEVLKEEDEEFLDDAEEVAMSKAEREEAITEDKVRNYHDAIYETSTLDYGDEGDFDIAEEDDFMRSHPLTIAGRFAPQPATVYLPKEKFVDPVSQLLTRTNHKHLSESAERIFGGPGLPHSVSTRPASEGKAQKAIPLDPSQAEWGNIEGDSFLAAVMPGTYATMMSIFVEVRRRLGTSWLEGLMKKKDGPLILDAGSGGAGIIAWHEVLQAEWLRMHEESDATSHGDAPLGKATVLAGSDVLRHRASKLLENTQFIPRLPEAVPTDDAEKNSAERRKVYDIIIAPHTLWNLPQEHLRKEQVSKYWSLLNPDGGVLILVEKGLPRGFEVLAAAREFLLDKRIASPGATEIETPLQDQVSRPEEDTRFTAKETGMIIAPCTNHKACPMYSTPGISKGRKDFCYFSQRYIRPPYLQRILNSRDRNHEDVQFSYLAVQRGRDQRLADHDILGNGVVQGEKATDEAFEGHEWKSEEELTTVEDVNPLSLPRVILPALKRRGHIIMDVCTPAGTLERWTVPRSFGKQAFRDARKVRWGDLWGLGAKTRIPKNVRLGRPGDQYDRKGRRIRKGKETHVVELQVGDGGVIPEEGGVKSGDRRDFFVQFRRVKGGESRDTLHVGVGREENGRTPRAKYVSPHTPFFFFPARWTPTTELNV